MFNIVRPLQGEGAEPVTEADHLALRAHDTFTRVYGPIAEEMLGRKVLAAIILTSNKFPEGQVIALGTGASKCLYCIKIFILCMFVLLQSVYIASRCLLIS